ncbi:MAG: nucleotidyltransferase domain-containing protein [Lachnospiraceae bacterium]|nr:nucleotidyltransferase domain-containing protein [Lachnospiraceae bacterium]
MRHLENLDIRNKKIIDAVIEKANNICPGSLALIGVYGSFATGDFHEKSDLDLLVLINDDNGWQLGCTFIQDDLKVGHDIYCTTWEDLQNDSLYNNPNISKLMDSKIVYCADMKYADNLELLRKKVIDILQAPFSMEDYMKAEHMMREAEHYYMLAMISDDMDDIWAQSGNVIYYIENAVAMLNKKYFHFGTKRTYEELELMEKRPQNLCGMIEDVLSANAAGDVKNYLTILIQETVRVCRESKEDVLILRKSVTDDVITGTYEEMYSNWRNKMYSAVQNDDRHLAFMSLISLNEMIADVGNEADIAKYNVLNGYDSQNLSKTALSFDDTINEYLKEYKKIGLQVKRYADIDAFVRGYLRS